MKSNPKRIKENQEQVISLLRQAMAAMGDDFAMLEARNHVMQAMQLTSKTAQRRLNRASAAEKFAEEAKQRSEKWWKMIEENAVKLAKESIEKLDESTAGQVDH